MLATHEASSDGRDHRLRFGGGPAGGFSHHHLSRAERLTAISACVSFGLAMSDEVDVRARRPPANRFPPTRSPTSPANFRRVRRCEATTAFSTGWHGTSKKRGVWRNALLCGPAHEPVADERDIERRFRHRQFHPCASRTAIIVFRTAGPGVRAASSWRSGTCSPSQRDVREARVRAFRLGRASSSRRAAGDIQLAVGIGRQTMTAGLVVRPRPLTVASLGH